ncbi:MAG: hypothetical protein QW118_02340 [Nitrososphaerota archaeon]
MWVGPPAYPEIRQGAYLSGEDRSGYAKVRLLGGQRQRMRTVMDISIQVWMSISSIFSKPKRLC